MGRASLGKAVGILGGPSVGEQRHWWEGRVWRMAGFDGPSFCPLLPPLLVISKSHIITFQNIDKTELWNRLSPCFWRY